MCLHAYAVDVGNFSPKTCSITIHDNLGLRQANVTRQEQLWHTEYVYMLMQLMWETFLPKPVKL